MNNEERPNQAKVDDVPLSQLMLCHFGEELQGHHMRFGEVINDLLKMSCDASRSLESCIPLRQIFLQDYSALEKVLVLINVVLFSASLSAENVDKEVGVAILYIMFAIAYFITTTSCLSGASSLKRKAIHSSAESAETSIDTPVKETQLLTERDANAGKPAQHGKAGNKKQVSGKRVVDNRKSANPVNSQEKKQITIVPNQLPNLKTRQKKSLCAKVWSIVNVAAETCESYASRFLRLSFFILNLMMLWLCVVNLN